MTPSTRTPDRYDLLSRILRWSVAALVLAQFALGWTMPDVHGTAPPVGLVAWHVALGTALIVVIAARLLWSIVRRSPPAHQQGALLSFAASATHKLLYAALIAVPLLGWLNANGRTWQLKLAGAIPLPTIAAPHSLGAAIGEWHSLSATLFIVLIGMHALAALVHRFVMKDGAFERMI
ncbi:prokaryotic cytochrome b561 family protein [Burkholderia pseudomallei MSHR1153]|uniref:cytochrome b n=1 Tax=Burkholderia pseudomallei TaxID=28450 RepID=UPI00052B08BF|nr:cytochrome b/b6 domain-containing protein [Burkholderia pseudomallei]AIV54314.1 prokaryotic cytochrome b561 family protein [Burkholderia pseudomallei MSHR1153]